MSVSPSDARELAQLLKLFAVTSERKNVNVRSPGIQLDREGAKAVRPAAKRLASKLVLLSKTVVGAGLVVFLFKYKPFATAFRSAINAVIESLPPGATKSLRETIVRLARRVPGVAKMFPLVVPPSVAADVENRQKSKRGKLATALWLGVKIASIAGVASVAGGVALGSDALTGVVTTLPAAYLKYVGVFTKVGHHARAAGRAAASAARAYGRIHPVVSAAAGYFGRRRGGR